MCRAFARAESISVMYVSPPVMVSLPLLMLTSRPAFWRAETTESPLERLTVPLLVVNEALSNPKSPKVVEALNIA